MTKDQSSVLRRMAARSAGQARQVGAQGPVHALGLALARAAEAELGLDLSAEQVTEIAPRLDALAESAEDDALVALLEGPGGSAGLAILSAPLLATVVSYRLTGAAPAVPVPRAPTLIDAAMSRGFIDRCLAELCEAMPDGQPGCGFRYRELVTDARRIQLALPQADYRGFRFEVTMAGGAAKGALSLVFSLPHSGAAPRDRRDEGSVTDERQVLRDRVLGAEVPVDAVLLRTRMPLAELAGLAVGDCIPLTRTTIDEVRLEGPDGRLLGIGRLGRTHGDRAIRLTRVEGRAERNAPGAGPGAQGPSGGEEEKAAQATAAIPD